MLTGALRNSEKMTGRTPLEEILARMTEADEVGSKSDAVIQTMMENKDDSQIPKKPWCESGSI